MNKNYLFLIQIFCAFNFGFGQIITFDFNGLTGSEVSAGSNFNDPNLAASTISRGAGLNATNNGNRFNANNWALSNIANAIAGDNYMEFTITPNATYEFDVTTIDVNFQRSATGTRGILLRSSLDGYSSDIDTEKSIVDNTSVQTFTFTVGQTGNTGAVTYRIYGWAEATGGTGGFEGTGNDIIVNGSVNLSCTPTHTLTSFAPTEGPIGTVVTITGDNFSNTTSVDFNGLAASNIIYLDTDADGTIDTLLARIAGGSTSGNITITEAGCPISSTSSFTIIENSGGCISSSLSDLIISELYDKSSGSLSYIEIYNGTGVAVNLSSYSIRRYGSPADVTAVPDNYTLYTFPLTTPTINNNQVIYGKVFSPTEPPDDATPDFTFDIDCSNTNPLNSNCGGFNGSDVFHLYNGSTIIDVYENPNSGSGYTVKRDTNTTGPNATSNPSDWTYLSTEEIGTSATNGLGFFNYTGSTISFPSTTNPVNIAGSCINSVSFTSSGTASIGGALTYQWYYNDGINISWNLVNATNLPLTNISGETSAILTLNGGLINYDNYQFYCLVTENGSCSTVSNSAQLQIGTASWDGTNWIWNNGTALNTLPTIDDNVVLNDDYNTSTGGLQTSFEACSCLVNSGNLLTIANNTHVLVQNDLTVDGAIVVNPDGSFVQVSDAAIVNGDVLSDKTKISVEKRTAPLATFFEYTYWSSPVVGETISAGLFEAFDNRIYSFNGQNFRDSTMEMNNDNTTMTGQDDIDDDGNDWQFANGSTVMSPGVGYASTHDPIGFIPNQYVYTFEGAFNNGIYNVPVYRNDDETNDNNWNFIGNPYPSAIAVDGSNGFLAQNAGVIDGNVTGGTINGAIFLWSHNTAADGNTNGNENLNYAQGDYAIINGSGQTAGGDGIIPSRFIPSGQGFFISMDDSATSSVFSGNIRTADVVFNNAMRVTGNNDIFFRNPIEFNKLWLKLTTDNGSSNQLLVAYVEGASDEDDGMYYDAIRNLSSEPNTTIYSLINSSNKKFAIQGKNPSSLSIDEIIPIGLSTIIDEPTLYTLSIDALQGEFLINNDIFIIDHTLNSIHNIKNSDYTFTSDAGEFNSRFEIVFRADALSLNDYNLGSDNLEILELSNNKVRFSIGENFTINRIEILDLMGRNVYDLQVNTSSEVYDLSKLSSSAYIAKVTLSNGQVITKKAIKR